ncbi:hypothetical protein ACIBCH_05705 [Amycolatopsis thailandensis]|uniref:hypothetical protein n=1 Tax=Amycolatopsis thailandensis TaxID=589330 RepID=UPI0037B25923
MSPLDVDEGGIGDTAVRWNEYVDLLLARDPFQAVAAERPSSGEHRVSPAVEHRGASAMFFGRFTVAQQHDAGQQHSPRAALGASTRDGPAWHTDPFEIGRADHLRSVLSGEQGMSEPVSS